MNYRYSFKSWLLLILFPGISITTIAQVNLIPNHNFKDINKCCEYHIHCAPEGWWTTSGGTFNFIPLKYDKDKKPIPRPAMFMAYDSRFDNCRSYIQASLLCPLTAGSKYILTIHIRPKTHAIDRVGIYFSDSFINVPKRDTYVVDANGFFTVFKVDSLLPFEPQIEFKGDDYLKKGRRWIRLSFEYTANGSEKFIVAGNFRQDAEQKRSKRFFAPESAGPVFYELSSMSLTPVNISESCDTKPQYEVLGRMNRRHSFFGSCEDTVKVDMNRIFAGTPSWQEHFGMNPHDTKDSSFIPVEGKVYRLNNVLFDLDRASIQAVSFPILDSLADILLTYPQLHISIFGHTDSMGSEAYNLQLSAERAKSVMEYLIIQGIEPERCSYHGFGASRPIADNKSEEGRQLNRRVEFVLVGE